jgi:two-component system chemotaxis response regulator CheY
MEGSVATFVIIDDSQVARAFLRRVLEAEGQSVVGEAENGLAGYDLYARLKPDFVTIDLTMPVLDGFECLKRIVAEFPDARPIIVSSVSKKEQRQEALRLGAVQYLTKPLDVEEIREVIKSL